MSLRQQKQQGLGRGQLGQEIIAHPGGQLSWRLVHGELDNHICHFGRGLHTVELGRQRAEVAHVLALEPTLQLGEGDLSAERVHHVLGIRAVLDLVDLGHHSPLSVRVSRVSLTHAVV